MTSDIRASLAEGGARSVAAQVTDGFRAVLESRGYQADPAQHAAIELLASWLDSWLRGRRGWLRAPLAGVYLWGGVGRGKSFVMDAFFAAAPVAAKRRVHFHTFLQHVLARLQALTGQPDPLARVAAELAADTRLLCFDEFHVHDIGDAMLLGRLLRQLIGQGVGIVATSNYEPRVLCPNPLYRDRFKPTIELIERQFAVRQLDGGEDYRLRVKGGYVWGTYVQVPAAEQAQWVLDWLATPTVERDVGIEVNHRAMRLSARAGRTAWLDFDELFRLPRSSADFIWLNEAFERIVITGTPRLDSEGIDVQQRSLNFIDILYDSAVELILVADTGLDELLSAGAHVDFARTRSRLQQLRPWPAA